MTPQKELDYNQYLIDLSEIYEPPQPLISMGEIPLFSQGNISCITGAAKTRKSFLTCLFAAQFLYDNDNESVIIIDTEQAKFNTRKTVERIHKKLGWDTDKKNERLKVYTLRECSTPDRKKFAEIIINNEAASLIFIDGIRDLIFDINSQPESVEIVDLLMKLSSQRNCHICTILHINKNNDNVRGHIGTELTNKCETVLTVEKCNDNERRNDTSVVKPKQCKNLDFEDFYFRINDEDLPEFCDPLPITKKTDNLREWFNEILPTSVNLQYTELCEKIKVVSGKGKSTAENYIKEAVKQGIITKNSVGKYYSVENNNISEQCNLSY